MEWWMVTAGANAIMVVIYGLIAIEMIAAMINGHQFRSNPLLAATAAVFVTCTLGHGFHFMHSVVAVGFIGAGEITQAAVRAEFGDVRLLVWDAFTAVVAIYFYSLRSRFAIVYRGAALCEDMAKREGQALELHDNVVQGLVAAKLELDSGHRDEGRRTIEVTLGNARRIITDLLGREGTETALGAGELRRGHAVEVGSK